MRIIVRTFFILFALGAGHAFAQVKHIVLDMDEVIVRQVPGSMKGQYAPSSKVLARDGYQKLYVKMPHVAEAFMRLQKENSIIVHFLTNKNKQWAETILNSFVLMKPFEETLLLHFGSGSVNKIISASELDNGVLDLTSITGDTDNILVVTNNLTYFGGKESPNRIALPKTLYYYNSFQDAEQARAGFTSSGSLDAHKGHLPSTEEEWAAEHFKVAGVMAKFLDLNLFTSSNAVTIAPAINNYNVEKSVQLGLKLAENRFHENIVQWVYDSAKSNVTGCELFNIKNDVRINSISIDECENQLPTELAFDFDPSRYTVKSCHQRETRHGAKVTERPLKECLTGSELSYYWKIDNGERECGSFVQDTFYLEEAPDSYCHVLFFQLENGSPKIGMDLSILGLKSVAKEFMDLEHNSPIPEYMFRDFDVNYLATSLVLRKHENEPKEPKPRYDFFQDTKITMAFDDKWIQEVAQKGFLNQHQIGHSNGTFSPTRRAYREDNFLGVKIENGYGSVGEKAHRFRPKYSYLVLTKANDQTGYTRIMPHYGNVYAVFKEKTKTRATFTTQDSLGSSQYHDVRTFFYRSNDTLRLTGRYFETQIWGSAEVSKDVDHFLVNCPHVANIAQTNLSLLKQTGKPVYKCQVKTYGSYPYLLYKGAAL